MGGGQGFAAGRSNYPRRESPSAEAEGEVDLVVVDYRGQMSSEHEDEDRAENPDVSRDDSKQAESTNAAARVRKLRGKLKQYTPGSSMFCVQGKKGTEIAIPDVTTLLVVGLKGAGKSALINNVSRVLCNKPTGFSRAHVSDDPTENGTHFIAEHMLCGRSGRPRVSLFDTRGLPEDDTDEGVSLLESWMKDGVRHGQMDLRPSDDWDLRRLLETRGRHANHELSRMRSVNFVIFVVDAVSVLEMQKSGDAAARAHLVQLYKTPYLTFKDDRPMVVMTHGDKLSPDEKISAKTYLGETLGVPPADQIFDIPGVTMDDTTESDARDVRILEMLSYALDCADRNLPYKLTSVLESLQKMFTAMCGDLGELDCRRKVALVGLIFCVYILVVLCAIAGISLTMMMGKKKKFYRRL